MYCLWEENANCLSARTISRVWGSFLPFLPFVRRRNGTHPNHDKKNRSPATQSPRGTTATRGNHYPLRKRRFLLSFSPSIGDYYNRPIRLVLRLPPKPDHPIPRKHHQDQLRHRKLRQSPCSIQKPKNDHSGSDRLHRQP